MTLRLHVVADIPDKFLRVLGLKSRIPTSHATCVEGHSCMDDEEWKGSDVSKNVKASITGILAPSLDSFLHIYGCVHIVHNVLYGMF